MTSQLFAFDKKYPTTPPDPEKARAIVNLAKEINAGDCANHASKASWFDAIKRLAERDRGKGETSEQAFVRYIATDDGRELWGAYKSASGPDFQPVPSVQPMVKADSAYAKLTKIAEGIRAEQPALTREQSFAKAFTAPENRALAERAKTEQAFE